MKQIVDKLNKIAKKINENVELSDRDLIIDSLDSITKAYGGTPNDSNLIVDKLEDIYSNIGAAPSGNIEITENTAEPLDISQYATATVNVAGGGGDNVKTLELTVNNTGSTEIYMSFIVTDEGIFKESLQIPGNTTDIITVLISEDSGDYYYEVSSDYTVTFIEGENCTFNSEYNSFEITDITQSASATANIQSGLA